MKTNFLFSLCLFLCGALYAQEDYGRKVVKELASSKYYGRGYIFDGDLKAANYIAKEFQKIGIAPLSGTSPDYFQYFNLSPNTFPKETTLTIDGISLKVGKDFLIDAASKTKKGTFEWTKIGTKPFTKDNVIQSVLDSDEIAGKFIYIDEKEFIDQFGADLFKSFLESLKKEGNHEGIIVNSSQKLLWRTLTYQIEKPVFYLKDFKNGKSNGKVAVNIQSTYKVDYRTQNVAGFLKGSVETDSTIVITGHYDHIGAIGKKVVFNGANDNASGIAMLLYLSQYLKQNPIKYNVVFLAFSGEESGLLGSKYFAENSLIDLNKIKFLINLDMAGTGDDGIQVVNGSIFKEQFDQMVSLNNKHQLLPEVRVRGAMNRSDHYPFYERGVPCFFIYTLGGIDAYHDIYDIYDTLPFTNFTNYANLLTKFIEQL